MHFNMMHEIQASILFCENLLGVFKKWIPGY